VRHGRQLADRILGSRRTLIAAAAVAVCAAAGLVIYRDGVYGLIENAENLAVITALRNFADRKERHSADTNPPRQAKPKTAPPAPAASTDMETCRCPAQPGDDSSQPDPAGRTSVTGKIQILKYDRFGDFQGFILETPAGKYELASRELGIAALAYRALRKGLRITVVLSAHDRAYEIEEILIEK
jgi:hypothetical protein